MLLTLVMFSTLPFPGPVPCLFLIRKQFSGPLWGCSWIVFLLFGPGLLLPGRERPRDRCPLSYHTSAGLPVPERTSLGWAYLNQDNGLCSMRLKLSEIVADPALLPGSCPAPALAVCLLGVCDSSLLLLANNQYKEYI